MITTQQQMKMKERSKQAISLAMESKWEEAASVNREILADAPDNVEALNRLGKALSELGRYGEARDAFNQVLRIQPSNTIAKKNAERLNAVRDTEPRGSRQGVPSHFFIEETGKTGVTSLVDPAAKAVIAKLVAGEPVTLEAKEHQLIARNSGRDYLGIVEPKLGLRLLRLIRGGNRYEAAIAGISDQGIRLIIKESYQHPSQIGRPSFPPKGHDGFRPYVWDGARLGKTDAEEATAEEAEEWLEERGSDLEDVAEFKHTRGRGHKRPEMEEEEEF